MVCSLRELTLRQAVRGGKGKKAGFDFYPNLSKWAAGWARRVQIVNGIPAQDGMDNVAAGFYTPEKVYYVL